jgi:hypothetical protein
MGVLIAFPNKLFSLQDAQIIHIGNMIENNIQYINNDNLWNPFEFIYNIFWRSSKIKYDKWTIASNKPNRLIAIKLINKKTNRLFIVSTYHMPDTKHLFDIMAIHAFCIIKYIQSFAQSYPYVVADDFNIDPSTHLYNMIINGNLNVTMSDMYEHLFDDDNCIKLNSVYKLKNGKEPDFTVCSNQFIDCTDYIFVSEIWQVEEIINIPSRDTLINIESYPSNDNGSDHLLIGATTLFIP